MRHRTGTALLALALGTTFVACGGSDTKTVETKDGKVTVNKDDKSITIESDKGSATFGGASVPDDFPSDVPLPKGVKLQTAVSSGGAFQLGYQADDAELADVVADYKTALEDADFTVDDGASVSAGNGSFSGFSATGNGWKVTVAAIGGASGSILSVGVTKDE